MNQALFLLLYIHCHIILTANLVRYVPERKLKHREVQ